MKKNIFKKESVRTLIYFDYSATTPVDKNILLKFTHDNEAYFANPNSLHSLGLEAKSKINQATLDILKIFSLEDYELIYTSGASESNNLAIKGVAMQNKSRGKKIITSNFEHSSVVSCLNFLAKEGFEIEIVGNDKCGLIDLDELEELLSEDTILVTIGAVNSETGIVQDLDKISKIIKKYPNTIFHSDMTQAVGKIKLNYQVVDLISFSAHKIYGIKGIGGLFRRGNIKLMPLINGGKSLSIYRSGTPATPMILSLRNALEYVFMDFDERFSYIKELNQYFKEKLSELEHIEFNSNKYSLPQILNISFLDILSHSLQEEMSKRNIFISTSTACGSERPMSLIVKYLTGSDKRAQTSVRISLSHLTKKEEIDDFIAAYKEIINL